MVCTCAILVANRKRCTFLFETTPKYHVQLFPQEYLFSDIEGGFGVNSRRGALGLRDLLRRAGVLRIANTRCLRKRHVMMEGGRGVESLSRFKLLPVTNSSE